MTDLKTLALASKNCNRERGWYDFDTLAVTYGIGHTDAMLIAAASPDVVLALIKAKEDAEAHCRWADTEIEQMNEGIHKTSLKYCELITERDALQARVNAMEGRCDKLAARLEAAYDDSKPLAELMKEAQVIVESKHVFKKFIRGTPLENDIAVWMAEFAKENLLAPGAAPKTAEGRYQFVRSNGCGVCGVKLAEFEYERVETLDGEFVSNKVTPRLESVCCGGEVDVYDTVDDTNTGNTVEAVAAQAAPKPLTDEELEQLFCEITGLETGINPAAVDTKRALVWFKKGYRLAPRAEPKGEESEVLPSKDNKQKDVGNHRAPDTGHNAVLPTHAEGSVPNDVRVGADGPTTATAVEAPAADGAP